MGIERFFSSIEENKITTSKEGFTKTLNSRLDAKYFFIDFNSIIYITSYKVLSELNYVLYKIITNKIDRDKNKKLDKIIKDNNININDNTTPKSYNEQLTEDILSDLIISRVKSYILKELLNFIKPDKLKFFYIAIDGVPSKSKMLEQKKRRYMGAFAYNYKKRLFDKYEDVLKNNNRHQYEKYKITWGTYNITPGTVFMHKIDSLLGSEIFINNLKKVCKNLKTYIYSGPYEPGEGENKIVNRLRSMEQEPSDYLIYSPDSDVTLLCLLLNCKHTPLDKRLVTKLSILRHNQQKNNYDVVDIDKLSANIYIYINKEINKDMSPSRDNCINDIVFLLTIFGNDFLPKIESFNVKYDFDRIIDKYIQTLSENYTGNYNYIIDFDYTSKDKIIDQQILVKILHKLQIDEGSNLQKVYMSTNYQNYNRLKKIMGADQENFTEVLSQFLDNLRKFHNDISLRENRDKLKKWLNNDKFLNKLKRLVHLQELKGKNLNKVKNEDFIYTYIEHYDRYKKLPQVMVTFKKFARTINDIYHRSKLEKTLDNIDPNLELTPYDEELYKFDYMLDEYVKKLNSRSIDIGYISVDPKTYSFKTEKIIKGVKRYYKEYFDIDDINSKKMVNITKTYLKGLVWVFEYYFNHHDIEYHRENADIMFYPYSHAPLLKQIYEILQRLNDDFLKNVSDKLEEKKVDRKSFFNTLEQMMYVTPVQIFTEMIPKEYKDFVKSSGYYPNMNKVVDNIWNDVNNDEIDCRGVIFLTKCHLKVNNEIQDFDEDREFIKKLRSIELKPETKVRRGVYNENKPNIVIRNF